MILACFIEPFTYYQQINIIDNENDNIKETKKILLVDLYHFVPEYCHQNNISKVKLFGNKEYNKMVLNQIKHNEKLLFSDYEPIDVEVM